MRTESLIRAQKKYYEKNKDKLVEYHRQYSKTSHGINTMTASIESNKSAWDNIIKDRGMNMCQLCGYNEHFSVIEFHHINPSNKKYQFNNMYRLKPTANRISELDKCIALCANCHRLVHNNVISIYKDELGWHRQ